MMASLNTTYEPFSKQQEYLELNRSFVRSVLPYFKGLSFAVDLACGIGILTGLLAAELQGQNAATPGHIGRAPGERLRVLGVDISWESLGLAREELASAGIWGRPRVHPPIQAPPLRALLIQSEGDRLPIRSAAADAVLLGNAIHLFSDKHRLVEEVCRVLRPQGAFAFNTAFHEGSRLEGTDRFYDEWFKQTLRYIKRRMAERPTQAGVVSRRRGSGPVAFSNPRLSPLEYRALLEAGGFRVENVTERTIEMSSSNLEAIGSYAEFAAAQLSGYPVELACEALVRTVATTLETLGHVTVPRSWLEVIAVKH